MEKINVVLTVYKRTFLFEEQLSNIAQQSCVDDIVLHVISNNPGYNYDKISKIYKNNLNIKFVQRYNKFKFIERHIYIYKNKFNYVIILDDDFLLNNDSIEKLWNKKNKNTFYTFFGRNFQDRSDIKNLYVGNPPVQGCNDYEVLNYGGPGFSVIDCSIYDSFFRTYGSLKNTNLSNMILNLDDIFLSWVINNNKHWSIKNSDIVPTNFFTYTDEHASFVHLMENKNELCYELHKINEWKNL